MKKFFVLTACMTCIFSLQAQHLENNVFIRSAVFNHPVDGPYAEISITIPGYAVNYITSGNHKKQGGAEVDIYVMDGNNVVNYDKYQLNSPVLDDTAAISFSLVDQKRLSIPDKTVSLEVKVTDLNDPANTYDKTEPLVSAFTGKLEFSDVQLIDTYQKSETKNNFSKDGIDMMPYPFDFFPSERNKLIFYGELYNSDKNISDSQFLISFSIRAAGTDAINPSFYEYEKYETSQVVSFLKEMNIAALPTGTYDIVVEARSKKNELLAQKKLTITRMNYKAVSTLDDIAMTDISGTFTEHYTDEQLNYYLDVMRPRADATETKLIESLSPRTDAEMKKKFLYNFWLKRDSRDPYAAWLGYLELVKNVNESYGVPGKAGYKTDRGRVYLEYGPPSDIVTSVSDPGAYPYEIWFYATLPDKQTNIGFAFYEPSMVSDNYILLHSNARGELHDPRWKVKIYENVATPQEVNDFDNTDVQSKSQGRRAIDMYNF